MPSRPRFLLTFLAWAGGASGGDRHLLEVAARWRQNADVAVLAPPQAEPLVRSFLGDVVFHPFGSAGAHQAAAGPLLALEYVRRGLGVSFRRPAACDVVVAASHFTPDAAALRALARTGALGVGYVYHLVAARPGHDPRTLWSKADERFALSLLRRHAGVVFASNERTARELTGRGFDPIRTAVGIDVASLPRSDPSGPPRAAFLARMARSKGVEDAVRAWALVRRSLPDARLVMAGSGPERRAGAALAESLGLADAIEWPGFLDEEEKRRLLAETSLLLAPSYEEGWGISVCEALGSGVPVVAYRLPVLDELFDSAYLGAKPGDVDELARLATRVLMDDAEARALAQRGLATAARYDVGQVAEDELEAILRRLGR